ncbi:LLM class flavin-dependent oxidoreductase [Nocardia vinacea]|uniref:LLM class flavin-dependent oxidoreductase n=1 Tax=Nocardia vinacea TaxID=96468 RepID=UPI00341B762E
MDFGLVMMNYAGCWDDAAFAEEHGFATVGFTDSPLLCGDPLVSMALTAERTSKLRIGTLLNVPGMRTPQVTASAVSAVNHIAPGRVFFGTGTGYTGRLTYGLPPVSLAKTRNNLHDVRDLLAGRDVTYQDMGCEVVVRAVNSQFVENNTKHPVPFYMAADGPRALETVGQVADGWVATLALAGATAMGDAPEVFARSFTAVKESAVGAQRNLDDAYTFWATALCILEPGEPANSPRALAQVGPYSIFNFHSYACNPTIASYLPPEVQERIDIYERNVLSRFDVPRERLYQEVHAGHLMHLLPGEEEVLTEEIIRNTALIGTAEEIAAQLHRMHEAGLRNVSLSIPPGHTREVIVDIETKLMPLLDLAPAPL